MRVVWFILQRHSYGDEMFKDIYTELGLRKIINACGTYSPFGPEANMAKLLVSEATWAAGDMCMQTYCGFGFAEEYDIERKFRETRLFRKAPVSTNLVLSYIGEHILKLPRSF